jgi:hypothetical protein
MASFKRVYSSVAFIASSQGFSRSILGRVPRVSEISFDLGGCLSERQGNYTPSGGRQKAPVLLRRGKCSSSQETALPAAS